MDLLTPVIGTLLLEKVELMSLPLSNYYLSLSVSVIKREREYLAPF